MITICMLFLLHFSTEQAKITEIIADLHIHFYIGLKYNNETGLFEWTTGQPVDYTNWAEYEPGNSRTH